ncbi:hypothetical protein BJ944DRAFT_164005 [Cunninghamella echinulata]|nr:hypothetical protein BJ944DRAFT_164005 [Cunninghamella echinulata]
MTVSSTSSATEAAPATTHKPRSMKAGERNVIRSNDSASLWNVTLSPGWTEDESEILRRCIIRFGVGNWAKIIDSGLLPGKTNAQMNLQLQRLLGQQSTSEFAGIHLDPKHVGNFNATRIGPDIRRKNNTIVNTGGKLTKEELQERKNKNKEIYGLPEHKWKNITLLTVKELKSKTVRQKESDLKQLKRELQDVRKQIRDIAKLDPDRVERLMVFFLNIYINK